VGFKAEKPGELREVIDRALKAEGPALVDCVVPAGVLRAKIEKGFETCRRSGKPKKPEAQRLVKKVEVERV
jgi:thiamine pyrophosphate-dependent acetolactate synthase large subunit-like protein